MIIQKKDISYSGTIPANYEKYLGPMFFEPYAKVMSERTWYSYPQKVLELACGTGRLTRRLISEMPVESELTISDINTEMLREGKRYIQNGNSRLEWKVIDAAEIPYEDDTFDCIVCQFGVMFFCDRQKAFKEIYRTLKPGGKFIFCVWNEITDNPLARIADNVLKYYFSENTPPFYSVLYSYNDAEIIKKDLSQGGFGEIMIENCELSGYSESARHSAQGLVEGTPAISAIQERDITKLPFIMQKMISDITLEFGENDLSIPLSAKVVTVKKTILN